MATHRFDDFTKSFAAGFSRRTALRATGRGLAAGLAASRVTAQDATPAAPSGEGTAGPSFLFVQTATAGTFVANPDAGTPAADGTPTPGGGGAYLLTLEGHHGGTVYFSDRPERVFGVAPTQPFLDGLGLTPANPPNAALVTRAEDGTEDVVVLELLNPAYDEAAGTLTYGATILAEYQGDGLAHAAAQQQDDALPATFGQSSLFIDACTPRTECGGSVFAGRTFHWKTVGPLPVGPITTCWHLGDFVCHPCNEQGDFNPFLDNDFFDRICNNTYPECNGNCVAT